MKRTSLLSFVVFSGLLVSSAPPVLGMMSQDGSSDASVHVSSSRQEASDRTTGTLARALELAGPNVTDGAELQYFQARAVLEAFSDNSHATAILTGEAPDFWVTFLAKIHGDQKGLVEWADLSSDTQCGFMRQATRLTERNLLKAYYKTGTIDKALSLLGEVSEYTRRLQTIFQDPRSRVLPGDERFSLPPSPSSSSITPAQQEEEAQTNVFSPNMSTEERQGALKKFIKPLPGDEDGTKRLVDWANSQLRKLGMPLFDFDTLWNYTTSHQDRFGSVFSVVMRSVFAPHKHAQLLSGNVQFQLMDEYNKNALMKNSQSAGAASTSVSVEDSTTAVTAPMTTATQVADNHPQKDAPSPSASSSSAAVEGEAAKVNAFSNEFEKEQRLNEYKDIYNTLSKDETGARALMAWANAQLTALGRDALRVEDLWAHASTHQDPFGSITHVVLSRVLSKHDASYFSHAKDIQFMDRFNAEKVRTSQAASSGTSAVATPTMPSATAAPQDIDSEDDEEKEDSQSPLVFSSPVTMDEENTKPATSSALPTAAVTSIFDGGDVGARRAALTHYIDNLDLTLQGTMAGAQKVVEWLNSQMLSGMTPLNFEAEWQAAMAAAARTLQMRHISKDYQDEAAFMGIQVMLNMGMTQRGFSGDTGNLTLGPQLWASQNAARLLPSSSISPAKPAEPNVLSGSPAQSTLAPPPPPPLPQPVALGSSTRTQRTFTVSPPLGAGAWDPWTGQNPLDGVTHPAQVPSSASAFSAATAATTPSSTTTTTSSSSSSSSSGGTGGAIDDTVDPKSKASSSAKGDEEDEDDGEATSLSGNSGDLNPENFPEDVLRNAGEQPDFKYHFSDDLNQWVCIPKPSFGKYSWSNPKGDWVAFKKPSAKKGWSEQAGDFITRTTQDQNGGKAWCPVFGRWVRK